MRVNGTVEGDIEAAVGELGSSTAMSSVGDDVTYTSKQEAQISDGAQIGGAVERRRAAARDRVAAIAR